MTGFVIFIWTVVFVLFYFLRKINKLDPNDIKH